MFFELAVASYYLFPRWRRLSLSIVSFIAVFVIALVVWLNLVFFSVTSSLERSWIDKLVNLSAPLRIVPTDAYYRSWYHQIDTISFSSDYTPKNLKEKFDSLATDPYDQEFDEEIPSDWPPPLLDKTGVPVDLVKEVFSIFEGVKQDVPCLDISFYEVAAASIHFQFERDEGQEKIGKEVFQHVFLLPLDSTQDSLKNTILSPSLVTASEGRVVFPKSERGMEPVLIPKSYRDIGISLGDRGILNYEVNTLTSKQQVKVPISVTGFYDPGILASGGKFFIARPELVGLVRSQTHQDLVPGGEGLHIRFEDVMRTDEIKTILKTEVEKRGLAPYFRLESFRDFDFTKPLLRELSSQKNLFTLLALLVIIVGCSNVISLLIILVHDKKKEIAILRALGASSRNIGLIFAISGFVIGLLGSLLGVVWSIITLLFIPEILNFLSWLQGFSAFEVFFGVGTPEIRLSMEALRFVLTSTAFLALLSGLIPAWRACKLKPSEALKNE